MNLVQLSTEDFTYTKSSNTFSIFISDLYDEDIPDLNEFQLRSHKTGAVKNFKFVCIERDRDGDITSWVYKDRSSDINVRIFND